MHALQKQTYTTVGQQLEKNKASLSAALPKCSVPWDYIPNRSYPLFQARDVLALLAAEKRKGGWGHQGEGHRAPSI